MFVQFHADDYGINDEISSAIEECIKCGPIESVSMICNTEGYKKVPLKMKKDGRIIQIRLHINLVEGCPVSLVENVPLLVNSKGEFRFTFLSFWFVYLLSRKSKKNRLKQQIKTEILAQMERIKPFTSNSEFYIDSHTHIHMLPFVFDTLMQIHEMSKIHFIRIPFEPFYMDWGNLTNYFSSNILKFTILRVLSSIYKKKLSNKGILFNQYFIGVLSTGNMKLSSIKSGLKTINERDCVVEVLLHPGGVDNEATIDWTNKKSFRKYYSSKNRKKEAELLKSLKQYL